ncbi:hypothetical protein V9T40_011917 [Parthenolecanium corni]|uniref:Ig-like domain-containing protein n=1 Tax=Parthenolecanium corni TaxID=536013 RepID=A0AAN9TM61_9HEMI
MMEGPFLPREVAWIHIDRQMILTIDRHVISRVPRFSVSHDSQQTWSLHVKNAEAEDRGYYMCQVNTNPMISQVGYLQVVVPPNIIDEESTLSSVAVRENLNLTLTCKAKGFPEPKITWKREDGNDIVLDRKKKVTVSMHTGRNLTITKISRTDMGAYLCMAMNGVPPSISKRIIVDVEFPPMILVSNQLVGAPVGTDVTIDCQTEAHPKAFTYWLFGQGMLLSANKHSTETTDSSYRIHMKLTIKNLRPEDFGSYKCISKNSLGETEGTIRLYEITMPSASPQEREAMTSRANRGYEDITESPVMQPTKPVRTDSTLKHKKKPPSPVNSIFRSTGTNSKIYHEKEAFYFIERLDLLFNERTY